MDVYLSRNALVQLEAILLLSDSAEGILSGHKRGQRYFVENVTAAPGALSIPLEKHSQIQGLLLEAFLGYFSTQPLEGRKKKLLGPAVMGQIFLEAAPVPDQKDRFRAYVMDYDGSFLLVPIKVKKARSGLRDKP